MNLTKSQIIELKQNGFKLCLVSPELQGHSIQDTISLKKLINQEAIDVDSVCTKVPEIWSE